MLRGWSPDSFHWVAGNNGSRVRYQDYIPGEDYTVKNRKAEWYKDTLGIVSDGPEIDSWNRWGSPYGATPLVMVDGSVRTMTDDVGWEVLGPLMAPKDGDVIQR